MSPRKVSKGGTRRSGNVNSGTGSEAEGKHSKGAQTPRERMIAKAVGAKTAKRKGIKYI